MSYPTFPQNLRHLVFLPWLVLGLISLFTYAYFFQAPYPGFDFAPAQGEVKDIFVKPSTGPELHVGDRFIQIGTVRWEDFRTNTRSLLFEGVQAGEIVPIIVERGGHPITIPWVYPAGPNQAEILDRLVSEWFLAYMFWLAGTLTFLFLRPTDTRWWLFLAFNFLTALWLATGTTSRWHVWDSQIFLRVGIWLSVPVYLHLHWVFPHPLGRLSNSVWQALYGISGLLVIAEWFQLLPLNGYFVGLLLALLGSVVLLIGHFIFQPSQRRELGLLVMAIGSTLFPITVIGAVGIFNAYPGTASGAFLTFALAPFAYLYVVYRKQLGGVEIRVNQVVTSYIFFLLLGTALLVLITLIDLRFEFSGKTIVFSMATAGIVALLTATSLRPFQRFVEHHLLGMPLPPTRLVEAYVEQIAASLDAAEIAHLLQDKVLPSLLVRQSALLQLDEAHQPTLLYATAVETADLPTRPEILHLLSKAGKYRLPGTAQFCTWAYVVLPLSVNHKHIGLWLLGHRDPDDFYTQSEISLLQSLAHQTAIALINCIQANQLHALYQADIERVENERIDLAWELHDQMLNQLALLKNSLADYPLPHGFLESYNVVSTSVRQTISGLRPAMLNYGLYTALSGYVDELTDQAKSDLTFELAVPQTDIRYDPRFEQHLYRIVQQACDNAIRHAQAQHLYIQGELTETMVNLMIVDDGVGFAAGAVLDLPWLLAHKHFGLAGMQERAALIGAQMHIQSTLGQGTRIRIYWSQSPTNQT